MRIRIDAWCMLLWGSACVLWYCMAGSPLIIKDLDLYPQPRSALGPHTHL